MHLGALIFSGGGGGGGVAQALPTPTCPGSGTIRCGCVGLIDGPTVLLGTSRVPESPAAQQRPEPASSSPAMKQTLGDLMRMSRICRMVFATCLGSFILVIFYFQSMFQPGRMSLLAVSIPEHHYAARGVRFAVAIARWHID